MIDINEYYLTYNQDYVYELLDLEGANSRNSLCPIEYYEVIEVTRFDHREPGVYEAKKTGSTFTLTLLSEA